MPHQGHYPQAFCAPPDVVSAPSPTHLSCQAGSGKGICPPGPDICPHGDRAGCGTRPPVSHSARPCIPEHRHRRSWRCRPRSAHGGTGPGSSRPRCAHTACPQSLQAQRVRPGPLDKVLPTATASAQSWLSSTPAPSIEPTGGRLIQAPPPAGHTPFSQTFQGSLALGGKLPQLNPSAGRDPFSNPC